jgi:hypothetical protein
LHDLIKKGNFHWEKVHTAAFTKLKLAMTSAPVLGLPDFSQPFILETDASGYGLGAVIMQNGRAIACYSSSLCPRNAALSTYEKEALAIIEALKRWCHYFLGHKLIIRTDQESLKFMTDQRIATSIQHKLMLKLLEFDFTLEYKKGKENIMADALSRKVHSLQEISMVTPAWIEEIEHSYSQDDTCKSILAELAVAPGSKPHHSLHLGIIRYKGRVYVGNNTALHTKLLLALHSSAVGGHSGIKAAYQRVKRIFYWPGMMAAVEKMVRECPTCQKAKGENCHYPGLLDPLPIPDMAWTHISMDFIEGLPNQMGRK